MSAAILIGAAAAIVAGFAWAVRGRSSAVFGASVYRGDRSRKSIALTFDDGPSESTPLILEVLASCDVRATFFMCGANVERLPEVARAVAAAGHEIGNHSDTHPRFDFCSEAVMSRELTEAQKKIVRATGVTPKLFRAPFGVRWFGLGAVQKRLDLLGVMWTVIGCDWKLPASGIVARIVKGADNGGIICLHDGRGIQVKPDIEATRKALEELVPELRNKGFAFETVSEILREAR
jgi:peptidoglycan-N-acetylglucosamine deacetylase